MTHLTESPIDQANACVAHLSAIEQLMAQAADGSRDMHLVDPGDLAMLLNDQIRRLREALRALEQPAGRAPLRSI